MMYEIHLACGDTVSSAVEPRLGAYRMCIHCDSRKRVVGIQYPPDTCVVCVRMMPERGCAIADRSENPHPQCPRYVAAAASIGERLFPGIDFGG